MNQIVTFGIGGYCADCDESHNHPLHNIVEWDGVSPYAPDGITLVPHAEHPQTAIGWTLIDGTWTAPPEPEQVQEDTSNL